MCVQDVKIGRNTKVETASYSATDLAGTAILGGAADRIALVVGYRNNPPPVDTRACSVGTRINGLIVPLVGISPYAPVGVVRIEDVGVLLLGEIVVCAASNGADLVSVASVLLTTELGKI